MNVTSRILGCTPPRESDFPAPHPPVKEENSLPLYTPEDLARLDEFARQSGLKIFPISVSGTGKQPCCKDWLGSAASNPSQEFASYLGRAGRFGIPCKCNNLLVVDCDVKDEESKGNGIAQFQAYCEKHGLPLSPVWQSTPSGGRHYCYKADFLEIIRCRTKITLDGEPVNIDIRSPGSQDSDGGYLVSDLSGRSGYEWHGYWSQLPSAPRKLVEDLASSGTRDYAPIPHFILEGDPPPHVIRNIEKCLKIIASAPEGERNNTVFILSCKIGRWLLPWPGQWEKWECRIHEAALNTGLPMGEAALAISQGRKGAEADGPYEKECYLPPVVPVSLTTPEHPAPFRRLPKEAFSERLWAFLGDIAEKCRSSREVALASLMTLVSHCLGRNGIIGIDRQSFQYSNLWTILVSTSGSAKTFIFELVTAQLMKIQEQLIAERQKKEDEWREWQLLSKAEQKERLRRGETAPPFPPSNLMIIKNPTIEALCENFMPAPRSILCYKDEGRSFFTQFNRYQSKDSGSSGSDELLPMFDSQSVIIARKTKDHQIHNVFVPQATLTLLTNIQPGLSQSVFSQKDINQGWPQRCCFIIAPDPAYPSVIEGDQEVTGPSIEDRITRITDKLWKAAKDGVTTVIDKSAMPYVIEYDKIVGKDFLTHMKPFWSFGLRHFWIKFRIINVLGFLEWALSDKSAPPASFDVTQTCRGLILSRWMLSNSISIFLGDTNQEMEIEGKALQRDIAKTVLAHENEIRAENHYVPNGVFYDWLDEAGCGGQTPQSLAKPIKGLGIENKRVSRMQNGEKVTIRLKFFSDEALDLCRKMAAPAASFLGVNDFNLASALVPEAPETAENSDLTSFGQGNPEDSGTPEKPEKPEEAGIRIEVQGTPPPAVAVAEDYANPYGFTHLHLHTDSSFQDAILKVGSAVEHAKKCNMAALAITDHGNLHNSRAFYLAARKAGIKPVIGCEIYLKNDGIFPAPPEGGKAKTSFHLTLLAETNQGLANLLAIQKHSYDNLYRSTPLVTHDFLAAHSKGMIAMSACLGGEIPQAILQGGDPRPTIAWYQKVFGENSFFFERMENGYKDLRVINPRLAALSQECGVPIVATSDVHYLNPEDREAYLVNSTRDWMIKTRMTMASRGEEPWDLHFRTGREMEALHDPAELKLAGEIAAMCDVELPEPGEGTHFMPPSEIITGTGKEPSEILKEKTESGLKSLGLADKPEYRERLEYEFEIIRQKGFDRYLLVIEDVVAEARRRGILVGPGRGSAAGCLICYCLGITQLDPILHELLFERFINPGRTSLPDVDLDFDEERRGEIVDYLRNKYGQECVAAIGTIGTRKGKTAINDVVRVFKNEGYLMLSGKEWDALGKSLSGRVSDSETKTITELVADGAFSEFETPEASQVLSLAAQLEGTSRQAGQHACGYVIAPHALETVMPLRRTGKGSPIITQWTKDEVEAAGYVKIDALGSATLTRIRKTLEKIEAAGKPAPEFTPDDAQTYDLFKSGHCAGIFQMTSDGMRSLVRKIQPRNLADLTVTIALYRPGPLNSGMADHFLKRRAGEETVSYFGLDDKLRPILEETSGVIVYQEQVMKIARAIAGFTEGEADDLRKAMGKKKADVMEAMKAQFLDGAVENGVGEEKAAELFAAMEKFAEYGFNKSHAASYALESYWTAYLKAHYPAEFLAACCETTDDNITPIVIAAECKRMEINPLDLPTNYDLSSLAKHPLEACGAKPDDLVHIADLKKGRSGVKIRAYAESVCETTVKNGAKAGQKMGKGKISDESGSIAFVVFTEAWKSGKIAKGKCYVLGGEVKQDKDNAMQFVVDAVEELKRLPG